MTDMFKLRRRQQREIEARKKAMADPEYVKRHADRALRIMTLKMEDEEDLKKITDKYLNDSQN